MSDQTNQGRGLLGRLRGALGERTPEPTEERRRSQRVSLPIPVRLKIGNGQPADRRLHDISQHGLCIETPDDGQPGEKVVVRFEGYPDVCDPFSLAGEIARVSEESPRGLVVLIDRQQTPQDALRQYRALILHYLRHKPLLEDVGKGYFEGRCEACGWIGRVGERNPTCSRCGGKAVPIDAPR